jgi:hypothetical protein
MAKQSGLGDNLYVAGVNVSGDVGALGRIGGGPSALEVTSIDKSAYERLGGLRDGAMEYTGFFNDSPLQLHQTLRSLPLTDQILTYCRGTVLGGEAACLVGKQITYDLSRPNDGSFTVATNAQANGFGIEWGQQLTAGMITIATATNGVGVDTTASLSFGAQIYLQVQAFTGTSAAIVLQDSADNASFLPVTGGAFASVTTAPQAQRVATGLTQTVRRYLRVSVTGTFTVLTYSMVVVKNQTATVF